MNHVRLNPAAIEAWAGSEDAKTILETFGEQVAADAKAAAPRDTGAGAESIHHEIGEDDEGAYVRVSWDREHFYMLFQEVGTSTQSAQPFLRAAAMKKRDL